MAARSVLGVLIALAAVALTSAARAETRLALIIANQSYAQAVGPLANPHNDAALMRGALEAQGFQVEVLLDQTRAEILLAVQDFADRLAPHGSDAVGFFYYAGHGVARPDTTRNYLIPVDVPTMQDRGVWIQSVPLDDVRRTLQETAPDAQHVVVFDACRNELLLPPSVRGRRGFQEPQPLGGMLTAFSASPGQYAEDGQGETNGPYAVALARQLRAARGALIETVFSEVGYAFVDRVQQPVFYYVPRRRVRLGAPAVEETSLTVPLPRDPVNLSETDPRNPEPFGVFRDCAACPEMVQLPGGVFLMGSTDAETEGFEIPSWYDVARERPQTSVTVAPFAIGRYEVTFAQWDACAADGYCRTITNDRGWGRGERPVITVSLNDITGDAESGERGFLAWLNARHAPAGQHYRLPSEAEWEYAARGRSQTAFSFGQNAAQLGEHAWYRDNSGSRTQPVGLRRPNPFGLYDVHGNVWEWTADCWRPTLANRPPDAVADMSGDCSNAVLRGGSWGSSPDWLRSAFRGWNPRSFRDDRVGFRLARTRVE